MSLTYQTSSELPPVYEECVKRWGVSFDNTIFTYGDTIHSKRPISEELLAHELVHVRQQTEMGKELWWERYFEDPQFRLEQEVEAYRAQYKWCLTSYSNREWVARALVQHAASLSGTMYGKIISFSEAIKLISK